MSTPPMFPPLNDLPAKNAQASVYPTMWMIRLRIKRNPTNQAEWNFFHVLGETEVLADKGLQRILAQAVRIVNVSKFPILRNTVQRTVPPPLTIEIPEARFKYVLELKHGVIQWLKEPIVFDGGCSSGNHWFFKQRLVAIPTKEAFLLARVQQYLFPMNAICQALSLYKVFIVTKAVMGPGKKMRYIYTTHWITANTLLQQMFEVLSGPCLTDRFALCRVRYSPDSQTLSEWEGALYTFEEARMNHTVVGELGWSVNEDVWLVPVTVQPKGCGDARS